MVRRTRHQGTRREWLALLGVAGTGGLAGCGSLGGGGNGAESEDLPEHYRNNEYVSATGSDAETVVHHQVADSQSGSAVGLTLDGAYAVTPEIEVYPLWMDLEMLDDDGQRYEAQLRENLQWSDPYGQMTADDWVYHIQNIHQGEGNWAGSQAAGNWAGIQVEQTGTLTFELELSAPNVDFPYEPVLWRAYCYPRDLIEPYVEEQDAEGLAQDEELNGLEYTGNLGPYTLERWDRDAEYVVTANEDYYVRDLENAPDEWSDAPHFEGYRYRVIGEESTRLAALRNREVTSAGVPAPRVGEFRDLDHIDVYEVPQPFQTVLAYNQRRNGWEPFRQRRVRQAFSTAIDKTVIAEDIQRGFAEVAQTFQPRWSDWYIDEEVREFGEGESHSYERARELLEEALGPDYGYNDADEFVDPEGEQVTLTMVYSDTAETTQTEAEFMGDELGEIGIQIEFNQMSGDRMLNQYVRNQWVDEGEPPWNAGPFNAGPRDQTESAREWDLLYGLAFNTYPRTPAATDAFWQERGDANFFGYVPAADMATKFQQARETADEQARRDILGEIFGIISEDQPVDFVAMSDSISGYQNYVEGPREEFGHGWNSLQTWRFSDV